jgi:hypothetical protein
MVDALASPPFSRDDYCGPSHWARQIYLHNGAHIDMTATWNVGCCSVTNGSPKIGLLID